MNTNEYGPYIDLNCFCGGKHCEGNLYIQLDTIDGKRVIMVTVTDTRGSDQSSLWLSQAQVKSLARELNQLLKCAKEDACTQD